MEYCSVCDKKVRSDSAECPALATPRQFVDDPAPLIRTGPGGTYIYDFNYDGVPLPRNRTAWMKWPLLLLSAGCAFAAGMVSPSSISLFAAALLFKLAARAAAEG